MSDAGSWDTRYAEGSDGWTLDEAPAVLGQVMARYAAPLRVLVPGAGRGHDAFAWARAGHEVVALDFAPRAVASMRARAEQDSFTLEVIEADVTAPPPSLTGGFDLIWEQTCLCALPPDSRRPYLDAMRTALDEGGQMIALLWNHGREGGPPHDMPPALVEALVDGIFEVGAQAAVDGALTTRDNQILWDLRPTRS